MAAASADPDARLAGRREARDGGGQARLLPAAGLRRRDAPAQGAARRGRRRPRLPPAGRRLRRELRRVLRRQHPRHLQGHAADGGGADLRRQVPGGEGRPHGRPVRQAALGADRGGRWPRAAVLPRRHRQRLRGRRGGAGARPRADAAGLPAVGGDAEPAARLQPGRLCRHHPHPLLDPRLHRRPARLRAVPQARQPHLRGAGVRRRRRGQPRHRRHPAPRRLLHQPRGALARVRGGAGPHRLDHRPAGRGLRPHDLDRRPHPPGRRRPRRVRAAACRTRSG